MDYKTLMEKRAAAKAKREAIAAAKAKEVEQVKVEEVQEDMAPAPKRRGRRPNNRVFMVVEDAPAVEALVEEKVEEPQEEAPVEEVQAEVQREEEEDLVLGDSILE